MKTTNKNLESLNSLKVNDELNKLNNLNKAVQILNTVTLIILKGIQRLKEKELIVVKQNKIIPKSYTPVPKSYTLESNLSMVGFTGFFNKTEHY